MAGVYDDSSEQTTLAAATRPARRAARHRFDGSPPRNSALAAATADFKQHTTAVCVELRPSGPLETVLVAGIVAATWRLRVRADATPESLDCPQTVRAARSLRAGIRALIRVRSLRASSAASTGSVRLLDASCPQEESCRWRERLVWDDAVSEDSPVVRGTWITVRQVISRIVDGWSWADVLRAHPELCEDDLRACLAFTVEDEDAR